MDSISSRWDFVNTWRDFDDHWIEQDGISSAGILSGLSIPVE
jgi:hypothetical protein